MATELDDRLTDIVGLGDTGLSCEKYLALTGENVTVAARR